MILTNKIAADLAQHHYGIKAKAEWLTGYDEQNFLLHSSEGRKFILKISDANELLLQAQSNIMLHLGQSSIGHYFQQLVKNTNGDFISVVSEDNKGWHIRMLTFLEGTFWANQKNKDVVLYENLGRFMGQMDKALQGVYHPAAERKYKWDIPRADLAIPKLHFIQDAEKRRVANYFLLQFETMVRPVINNLRHACIHGDANDHNILVDGQEIAGLIDFGDLIYSPLINNLAVACAYAMMDTPDPLDVAVRMVKGYHHAYLLQEQETDLLYYLIAARLCISVVNSAEQMAAGSGNPHHFLSDASAWSLLFKLLQINPLKAAASYRNACCFQPLSNPNRDEETLLHERKELIGHNLSISYHQPLTIVKGALQYLYDDNGNTYLDCVNNVSHVGHCHPDVVRAMQHQVATLNTNTRYLNDQIVQYARRLTDLLPAGLKVCYFVNSGSEANDLAIRMARQFTQRQDIIVLDHAYHGTSTLAMEMSPYKFDSKGGSGQKPYIHKALFPDLYRGPYGYDVSDAGERYAESVKRIVDELQQKNKPVAAFICETLSGVGGQMPLPENYLAKVYEAVRAGGGVCIADEVQVGFGRVGERFWGFELQEVVPDIVVMGKPIGNGHPLAAVVVTDAIASAFNNGLEYFNTFGGNPVSMATGLAVLSVIREEGLQQNALHTGGYLMDRLRHLMGGHQLIGDVRGHGLFIGVELVKDRATKEPAAQAADEIVERMKNRGYLLSTDGPMHNVLKIKPPIIFNRQNAEDLTSNLDEVMKELF